MMETVPLPARVRVEAYGGCNLHCPLCPTGQERPGRAAGPMPEEVFGEILRQLGSATRSLDFDIWGEPLLNPLLPQFIARAARMGVYTRVSTSLNHLPDAEALIRSGLHHLVISCDGFSARTYARYQLGGNIADVWHNIEEVVRQRHWNPDLRIDWRFVVFAHNQHEIPLVRARCRELGINADIIPTRLDLREEVLTPAAERIRRGRAWIPAESPIYDREALTRKTRLESCLRPWTEVGVDVDGAVIVCGSAFDPEFDMGNLLRQSFVDVWNGPGYEAARACLRGDGSGGSRTICHICKDNGFGDY